MVTFKTMLFKSMEGNILRRFAKGRFTPKSVLKVFQKSLNPLNFFLVKYCFKENCVKRSDPHQRTRLKHTKTP